MNLQSFSDAIAGILAAEEIDQVARFIHQASAALGFATFNISYYKSRVEDFMTQPDISSWSSSDVDSYVDSGFLGRDPLLHYVKGNKAPLFWNQDFIRRSQVHDYADMIVERNILGGATVPLPAPRGKFSAITFLSLQALPAAPSQCAELAKVIGHVSLAKLSQFDNLSLERPSQAGKLKQLTGKQIEVLKWLSTGKTNHEIAGIMGLPRRQIDYHVSEILQKLGVATRVQAATIYATR
ncbi:Autoinducer binding domain-containing protein [Paracoccus thiocyanatus]|uniref:Autoinducer binding domain-containing protein n=1 Tax=Paracoccus thiocyanatus TaxID=34006 RepID=A0A1N7AMF3_9RHOB|nr:LuxR family transcriptional regulator [Paracoccus thiocyanatus]SIR40183.1 Autoinducer binding domain-containing protein [Paracoccus thiocyanatus]